MGKTSWDLTFNRPTSDWDRCSYIQSKRLGLTTGFSGVRNIHGNVWSFPHSSSIRTEMEWNFFLLVDTLSSLAIIASCSIEKEIVSPLFIGWKVMGH